MWITYSRVSKPYQTVLIWIRGKYENQTSGNVLWKREEMSKGQSNKTERNKTDFSNTNRILSVVCQMRLMNCGNKKINELLKELEKYDLVQRKHRGLGKPNSR